MELKNLLLEKKSAILKRWFNITLEAYPSDTSNFLKKQKNRFNNPVGYTISNGIEGLFEEILKGFDPDKIYPFMESIIKINAVQDFSASRAISFIFLLKKVIRQELSDKSRDSGISEELLILESQIDGLALLSFDIYMQCREKIYDLKANEVKNMTYRLLKRANLLCEIQEDEPDLESTTIIQNKEG
ncbi:MAG: hypothetical protein A2Y97_05440 [Nitrospirae bacterium RBG_13_39_12]|nr:MAG: hypothetical protein A2Y97_05440 [Nitrospirae bacterium RBG_13_39_12]